jgi:hypothetical protein
MWQSGPELRLPLTIMAHCSVWSGHPVLCASLGTETIVTVIYTATITTIVLTWNARSAWVWR